MWINNLTNNYKKSIYLILLLVCILTIVYLSNSSLKQSTIPRNSTSINSWIMTKKVFDSITSNQSVAQYLKKSTVYLIGGSNVKGYTIIPTADFKDETLLAANINKLPTGTKAILYDDESWSYTPRVQQQDPAYYYKLAGQLAHSHGLKLIATPALDLIKVLNPSSKGNVQATSSYLKDNLAKEIASYADIYEIQSQRLIQNQTLFNNFINQSAKQAKTANSNIAVLAGVSTCAGSPTYQQLAQAIKNSANTVNGWWLNVPGSSPSSPNCKYSPSLIEQTIRSIF